MLFEIGVHDQLAGHNRHAAGRGDALALDQLQGLAGVPAVHEHQLAAARGHRVGAAVVGGHVEQGRGDEAHRDRRRDRRVRNHARGALGRQRLHLSREHHVHQVVDAAAMGELGAFRESGGPGGVEDADVGVGIDLHVRQVATARQYIRPWDRALRRIVGAHRDQLGVAQHARVLGQARKSFGVGEQDPGLGVLQAVGHFRGGPPGVHADGRHADTGAGPVDQHPLRIVAHGDGHSVAGPHPAVPHPPRDRGDLGVGLGVGDPFIAIDKVVARAEGGARQPQGADVRRGVLERPQLDPADLDLGDFQRRARLSEFRPGLLQFRIVHRSRFPDPRRRLSRRTLRCP